MTLVSITYFNYFYTYKRVAKEHKIIFLERFAKEFNESYKKGEFDDRLLAEPYMTTLKRIMKNPKQFYYDDSIWCLNEENLRLSNEKGFILSELEKNNGK